MTMMKIIIFHTQIHIAYQQQLLKSGHSRLIWTIFHPHLQLCDLMEFKYFCVDGKVFKIGGMEGVFVECYEIFL